MICFVLVVALPQLVVTRPFFPAQEQLTPPDQALATTNTIFPALATTTDSG